MSTANDSLLQRESVLSLTKHRWGFDALFVLGKDEDRSFSYSPCAWDTVLKTFSRKSALKPWALPETGNWRETVCWAALARCFLLNPLFSKQAELWIKVYGHCSNSVSQLSSYPLSFSNNMVCFIQLMKCFIFSITKSNHIYQCFWFASLFLTTSAFKSNCGAKLLSKVSWWQQRFWLQTTEAVRHRHKSWGATGELPGVMMRRKVGMSSARRLRASGQVPGKEDWAFSQTLLLTQGNPKFM